VTQQQEGVVLESARQAAARRAQRVLLRNGVLAVAVAALLGIALQLWVAPPDPHAQVRSTHSPRADGFLGAYRLAQRIGLPARRSTRSFGQLPMPPEKHTLLVIDPLSARALTAGGTHLDTAQLRALTDWIAAGGRVLLAMPGRRVVPLAGLEVDVRDLERASEHDLLHHLVGDARLGTDWSPLAGPLQGQGELGGLEGAVEELSAREAVLVAAFVRRGETAERVAARVNRGHGALRLVAFEPAAADPSASAGGDLQGFEPQLALAGAPLVLRRDQGAGSLLLASTAYPFTNLAIQRKDALTLATARLLHAVSDGGTRTLVFDEYTHGLWQRRGMLALLAASPVRYPVYAALLLFAVLAWRGAVRLGAPRPTAEAPRRAKEEFVISLADLAVRAGRQRAAARWLFHARKHLLPPSQTSPARRSLEERCRADGAPAPADLVRFAEDLERLVAESRAGRPTPPPNRPEATP
jgi:hypothetical protein